MQFLVLAPPGVGGGLHLDAPVLGRGSRNSRLYRQILHCGGWRFVDHVGADCHSGDHERNRALLLPAHSGRHVWAVDRNPGSPAQARASGTLGARVADRTLCLVWRVSCTIAESHSQRASRVGLKGKNDVSTREDSVTD